MSRKRRRQGGRASGTKAGNAPGGRVNRAASAKTALKGTFQLIRPAPIGEENRLGHLGPQRRHLLH